MERCLNDPALVGRVAEKFKLKIPQTMDSLVQSVRAGNAAEAARLAHAIKGTAGNLSATALSDMARQIEELGHAGDLSMAEAVLSQMKTELNRCLVELQEFDQPRPNVMA